MLTRVYIRMCCCNCRYCEHRWGGGGAAMPSVGLTFDAILDFSQLAAGVYFVLAEATVDQNWAAKTKSSRHPNPDIPPQRYVCA
jgi:hypothetical protein